MLIVRAGDLVCSQTTGGGTEIVPAWGFEPVGSWIRCHPHMMNPNSRKNHYNMMSSYCKEGTHMKIYAGIDVAKKTFDLNIHGQKEVFHFAYNDAGIK